MSERMVRVTCNGTISVDEFEDRTAAGSEENFFDDGVGVAIIRWMDDLRIERRGDFRPTRGRHYYNLMRS